LAAIFEQVPVTEQHSIMRDVFKHGLTFRESAFRTPWINPMLEHNLQILKEKGLLFLEQPSDDLDGLPSGRGDENLLEHLRGILKVIAAFIEKNGKGNIR